MQQEKCFFHLATTITTLWWREKKLFFSFSYYNQYAMIKRKKGFFWFSYYHHYAKIKTEKSFFQLATMFTNEEGKMFFFLFIHYDHYAMIKIKKFFFQLVGTITTPWSREKKGFFIQPLFPLMKKEKCCFSFFHCDHYAMTKSESFFFDLATTSTTLWSREKKVFFFIYLLRSIRHVQKRKKFFSFSHLVH